MPRRLIERNAEEALIVEFMCNRRLFGDAYSHLQHGYFGDMPPCSGVFIRPLVPTNLIIPGATKPGDVDLLVVPYEADQLILDQALAIEVKVIRATFEKQGRSPNEFGFSQAEALLNLGFPQVAVAHLIVSDKSPPSAWREVGKVTVLDSHGNCTAPTWTRADFLAADLIDRAFGRLQNLCRLQEIGLASAYVRLSDAEAAAEEVGGMFMSRGREASHNPRTRESVLGAIGDYFHSTAYGWLDTPRYDDALMRDEAHLRPNAE